MRPIPAHRCAAREDRLRRGQALHARLPRPEEALDRQRAHAWSSRTARKLKEVVCEYPIGHKRRRAEGMPVLVEKFRTNLARRFPAKQQKAILDVCMDAAAARGDAGQRVRRPVRDLIIRGRSCFNTLQTFKHGKLHSLPALAKALNLKVERLPVLASASCSNRCCATATARRSPRTHVRELAELEAERRAHRGDPVRASRASCCRTSPACRCSCDLAAMRSVAPSMGKNPKMIEPLVPVDLVVDHSVQVDFSGTPDALRAQHGARVQAQPRALPVPEVGHAGVRHLQGRAARHRHRAPGQPRIPGEGRAARRTAFTIPTRWSAPTRTPP